MGTPYLKGKNRDQQVAYGRLQIESHKERIRDLQKQAIDGADTAAEIKAHEERMGQWQKLVDANAG